MGTAVETCKGCLKGRNGCAEATMIKTKTLSSFLKCDLFYAFPLFC